MKRRQLINHGTTALGLAITVGLIPSGAFAQGTMGWNKNAFEAKSLDEVIQALGGASAIVSNGILLSAPEIAENGAVVRIAFESRIPDTTMLALIIEKNPAALSAAFDVPTQALASFATNVKIGQTSNVYALAKVGDRYFYAMQEVKVTLGGCGG